MRAVILEVPQALEPVRPVVIECLGVRAETVDGQVRLTWDGGTANI